ncbi:MAG: hypothetical protein H0X24_15460 [Ktedonobacterales bacterium]|nr:hypothetical protein [Ktedonobacterales bacterium]
MNPYAARLATQSPMTDPGPFATLYDLLPADLPTLCHIVRGLVRHRGMGWLYGYMVPEDEKAEADTREVALILQRILQRDPAPLASPRDWDHKFVGYCRVSAVLLCSMARAKGLTICARAGFSAYAGQGIGQQNWDHWICEYWQATHQRWVLIDPEEEERIQEVEGVHFDPYDIPRHLFVTPGEAWLACRQGQADPQQFGLDEAHAGFPYIRAQLLRDVAAMQHWEATVLDCWGLGAMADEELTLSELALLDQVARVAARGPDSLSELHQLYMEHPRLRAPYVS